DGKTFDVIGGLQGTGAGNYSLLDKKPNDGQNLYRLKQEDINNAITYSNVVEMQFGDRFADKKLHIFPNPATHTINLAIADQGNDKSVYSIRFMNSSGIVVKQVDSSEPQWQGNISYLQPGTYLVRVINNKTQNLVGENKFVKL
ncbi:MAG: type sorting protein, partial [Mucilaginibacter sp.]|nr:type sorting protein [Mucilaginibacter sp.]